MTTFFAWFLRNSRLLLLAGAGSFLLHTVSSTFSSGNHSFIEALKLTGALQMTLESPRLLDYTHTNVCVAVIDQISAWVVCAFGWLLIPLVVGALVSKTFEVRAAEDELILALVNAGVESGKKGQELDDFVNTNMAIFRKLAYGKALYRPRSTQ